MCVCLVFFFIRINININIHVWVRTFFMIWFHTGIIFFEKHHFSQHHFTYITLPRMRKRAHTMRLRNIVRVYVVCMRAWVFSVLACVCRPRPTIFCLFVCLFVCLGVFVCTFHYSFSDFHCFVIHYFGCSFLHTYIYIYRLPVKNVFDFTVFW